jgi:hypothetical protein
MTTATLDKLIWTLIYGGLLAVALGLSVQRTVDAIGWGLVSAGAVAAVTGAVLVFVRSRRKDTP